MSEGIGEVLTRLPSPPQCSLVVAKPEINVSTKFVYENLHAESLSYHPDVDGMIEAVKSGNLNKVADKLGNVLETVTIKEYPVIDEIKKLMNGEGAENALMSGSGPTVFGIFMDEETAKSTAEQIRQLGLSKQVFVTKFI